MRLKKGDTTSVEEVLHGKGGDLTFRREADYVRVTLPNSYKFEFNNDSLQRVVDNITLLSDYPRVWVRQEDRNKAEFFTYVDQGNDEFSIIRALGQEGVVTKWSAVEGLFMEMLAASTPPATPPKPVKL